MSFYVAFTESFLVIFVATNVLSAVPVYLKYASNKLLLEVSVSTFIIGSIFIIVGNYLFMVMGINLSEFEIAGGTVLFIMSIRNILGIGFSYTSGNNVGIIPIAFPLIIGPGAIAALITLKEVYPISAIMTSFFANCVANYFILRYSTGIYNVFKDNGVLVAEKIMALMFAAYGIMLAEKGIVLFLNNNWRLS